MQPQDTHPQDVPSPDPCAYESPKITDLSDGTTPLAAAPTVALPS